jgi:hypothetical protein
MACTIAEADAQAGFWHDVDPWKAAALIRRRFYQP